MDTNVNKIGFAGTFYTLWNVQTESIYLTDINGQSYLAGVKGHFNYIKNISTDLEKAKALHPDLEVDEDLYGRNKSWSDFKRADRVNENPHIMTFGKYINRDISELIEQDFDYILWMLDSKYEYSDNGNFAKNHPKVIEHFRQIEEAENEKERLHTELYNKVLADGEITIVLEKNLSVGDGYAYYSHKENGTSLELNFEGGTWKEMEYGGFTYGLPTLKGKAKRTKGKSVTLTVVGEVKDHWNLLRLSVELKSVN